jgi:hypothetical protein
MKNPHTFNHEIGGFTAVSLFFCDLPKPKSMDCTPILFQHFPILFSPYLLPHTFPVPTQAFSPIYYFLHRLKAAMRLFLSLSSSMISTFNCVKSGGREGKEMIIWRGKGGRRRGGHAHECRGGGIRTAEYIASRCLISKGIN